MATTKMPLLLSRRYFRTEDHMPTSLIKNLQGLNQVSQEQAAATLPATSPLGASMQGAESQDSVKMAGSSAQKMNAIRESTRTPTLAETLRTRQTTKEASQSEADRIAQLREMSKELGFLNVQFSEGVKGALSGTAGAPAQLGIKEEAINTLAKTPTEAAIYKEFAEKAAAGQIDAATVSQFAQAVGITSIDQAESTLRQLVETPAEAAARASGQLTKEKIDSLERPNAAAAYSRLQASEVAELQRAASDPNLPMSERESALRQLRQLGASGVEVATSEFAEMVEAANAAQEVTWNGETVPVDELLANDTIRLDAFDYLSATDPEYKRKLRERNPDFYAWVEANKAELEDEAKAATDAISQLRETRKANEALATPAPGVNLSSSALDAIFPGYSTAGVRGEVFPKPPIYQVFEDSGFDQSYKTQLGSTLTTLSQFSPAYARELSTFTSDELKQAGLTTTSSLTALTNKLTEASQVLQLNGDQFLEAVFGNTENLEDDLDAVFSMTSVPKFKGVLSGEQRELLSVLDANGDGFRDDAESIRQAYQAKFGTPASILAGIKQGVKPDTAKLPDILTSIKSTFEGVDPQAVQLKDMLKGDRRITADEFQRLNLGYEQMKDGMWRTLGDSGVRAAIQNKMEAERTETWDTFLKGAGIPKNPPSTITSAAQLEDVKRMMSALQESKNKAPPQSAQADLYLPGERGDIMLKHLATIYNKWVSQRSSSQTPSRSQGGQPTTRRLQER